MPVAYRVETERTVIRCWSPRDARQRREALDRSDRHLRPFIPYMKDEPAPLEATLAWLRTTRGRFDLDQDYRYAIFDEAEERLIGETGLYTRLGPDAREIGYWIDVASAGKGYATEAAAAMVRVAFEISRVGRVEIHCAPENRASALIPERLGFRHEATLARRSLDSDGKPHDSMIWVLFADAYKASPAAARPIAAFDAAGDRILRR